MKIILIVILFLILAPYCFAGTIISLAIGSSPFAVPCCVFKFDPVPQGSNSQAEFTIKNISSVSPAGYTVAIGSPFKVGLKNGTPQSSITGVLTGGGSVPIVVSLNNAPLGSTGNRTLTITASRFGTTESIPNWFATARVVPKQADLTIAITVNPPVAVQGNKNQVTMNISVTNKGFDGGPAPQVQISIDGKVETTIQFVSVQVGSTITQSNIQFLTSAKGPNHKITAFVDSSNIVPEFDETNNTAETTKDFP
jgi:CARDB